MNQTGVEITAGIGGFLVVFALGLAVWLMARDLSRRLRRMRLTEQERLRRERPESPEDGRGGAASPPRRAGSSDVTGHPARPQAPEPRDPVG